MLLSSYPLGRVFKIHEFFPARFCRILMSISSMVKWVTPLGRVFKIYDFFQYGFDDVLML